MNTLNVCMAHCKYCHEGPDKGDTREWLQAPKYPTMPANCRNDDQG